jgi:hypothetical protein
MVKNMQILNCKIAVQNYEHRLNNVTAKTNFQYI